MTHLDEIEHLVTEVHKREQPNVKMPYGVVKHVWCDVLGADVDAFLTQTEFYDRFNKCNVDVAFVGEVQRDKARLEAAHYLWGNKPLNQVVHTMLTMRSP